MVHVARLPEQFRRFVAQGQDESFRHGLARRAHLAEAGQPRAVGGVDIALQHAGLGREARLAQRGDALSGVRGVERHDVHAGIARQSFRNAAQVQRRVDHRDQLDIAVPEHGAAIGDAGLDHLARDGVRAGML
ncbi:Uncharacterised protein [Bordetella pertussis]|nr:Uncharacterised protein [Bordetella pertussis]